MWRVLHYLRVACGVCARGLAHVIMLPVDIMFLLWDVFCVNFRKTGIFESDCRGPLQSEGGGPCPPSVKYTNAWLFRLVCRDVLRLPEAPGFVCEAAARTRIYLVRGVITAVLIVVMAAAVTWATVTYWPKLAPEAEDTEAVAKLVAERIEEGSALFAQGSYQKALSFFEGALQRDPRNKEVAYRVGLCLEKLGQPERAARYFEEAARGEDAYPPAVNQMARYMFARGNMDWAARYAERAVELGAAEGCTHAILADRYIWTGDIETAGGHLDTALAKDAEGAIVRLVRAHLLISKGQLDEAGRLLDDLDDASVALLAGVYRLNLLSKGGRQKEAVEELERLADTHRGLPWPSLMLVDRHLAEGRRQEGLAAARRVEERFADSPAVLLNLARILNEHGLDGRASQIALICERVPQFSAPAKVLVGGIYLRRGLPELARDCAQQALRGDPGHLPALLLAGRAALARGDVEEAVGRFRAAVDAMPESAEARHLLAGAQKSAGDLAAALEGFEKACQLQPKSGTYHHDYGVALLAAGRNEQAREQFLQAVALLPGSYDSFTRLGALAQQEGDHAKAREYYAKALEIDPVRAFVAANNMAEMLLSENKDIPMALALAYSAHMHSRGSPLEKHTADTLASALIRAGYAANAVGVARDAVRARPDSPEPLFRLSMAEAAAGNTEEAIAALEKILQLELEPEVAGRVEKLIQRLREQEEQQEKGSASPEAATEAPE